MIRAAFVLGAVVAALAGGAGAPAAGSEPSPLYALRTTPATTMLLRLDRETLAPAAAGVRLDSFGTAWSVNAARSRLVAGSRETPTMGRPAGLRFVDLRAGRVEGTVRMPGELGRVVATAWVGRSVLAVVVRSRGLGVIAVDPEARRVRASQRLDARLVRGERSPQGLVLLLAPVEGVGPARLTVVDGLARARTVVLDRISAGWRYAAVEPYRATMRVPALAVDRRRGRAFVLGAGEPPATVDLRTLRVTYAAERALARAGKEVEGWSRLATALPDGRLVYSGSDYRGQEQTARIGVSLLDPRDWSARSIDADADSFVVAGGRILTLSWAQGAAARGLHVLGLDGSERFRLFDGRGVWEAQVTGDRAVVALSGQAREAAVVDLNDGRVLRETADPPDLLVGVGAPIWG